MLNRPVMQLVVVVEFSIGSSGNLINKTRQLRLGDTILIGLPEWVHKN